MLAKLKYSVDEEVQALMPEAVEIARKKKLERLQQLQNDLINNRSRQTNYVSSIMKATEVMDLQVIIQQELILCSQINLEIGSV